MSAAHDYDRFATADLPPSDDVPADAEPLRTLAVRLDAKLTELTEKGYAIQWLEIAEPQLVTLFSECGEDIIRLDPDPDVDKAWYGRFEVRATERTYIWIFLEGEVDGEVSAHVVT